MKCEVCEKHKENIREYFNYIDKDLMLKRRQRNTLKSIMLDLMLNRGSMKSMYKN